MISLFDQTVRYSMKLAVYSGFFDKLPEVILEHTQWGYSCRRTDRGCLLKPMFRDMPYRNSFVPEIDIVVFVEAGETVLHMRGRPVKFVRVFMTCWFALLTMLEVLLLIHAINSHWDNMFPVILPVGMCVFGYLLCRFATKAAFRSIVNAITESCFPEQNGR